MIVGEIWAQYKVEIIIVHISDPFVNSSTRSIYIITSHLFIILFD